MTIPLSQSDNPFIISAKADVLLYVDRIDSAGPGAIEIFANFTGGPYAVIPSVCILNENDWLLVNWYTTAKKLTFISARIHGSTRKYKITFGPLASPLNYRPKSHLKKFHNLIIDDV